MTRAPQNPGPLTLLRQGIRRHPWITAVMMGGVLVGAAGGYVIATEAWPVWRRLAAGALAGFWVAFLITATRMMGAFPR